MVAPLELAAAAMRRVIVRYRVKPELAAGNEKLVRAVYAELEAHNVCFTDGDLDHRRPGEAS
ncbi:MAG TPA: hypothetical protein VIX82_11445 [Solirubrobacteraceae bacterium]